VRVAHAPGASRLPTNEGVVEDVAGPNDEGTGWNLTVRIGEPGAGGSLVSIAESELEATGLALDERGERVPLAERPRADERRDRIELRLFTELADGIAAARTAEEVERELAEMVSASAITIVAERHWSEPYNYEFGVTIEPFDDPVEALGELALMGEGGWISSRDDGWRFDLWWSGGPDADAVFLVADVHGAEVSFLPWRSPRRRPEDERPLLAVPIRSGLDEPGGREDDELDPEPGDEEP
jgi:hypothetical protein